MQAYKLNLPDAHPSLVVSSLFFEPLSRSLALMHTDSSILLYPSLSLFPPSPPPPPTPIPPHSTTACFIRLHSNPNSAPSESNHALFLTASPFNAGSSVLLRAWILRNNQVFAPVRLHFKRDLRDIAKLGAVLDLSHGFSVSLSGSVNVFALHSISARKIWVLAAKLVASGDGGMAVDLIKCAVIDCTLPIFSVKVSLWHLLLGEENGVRVFSLRPLVKGRVKKQRDSVSSSRRMIEDSLKSDLYESRAKSFRNGVIPVVFGNNVMYAASAIYSNQLTTNCNGTSTGLEAEISSNGFKGKAEVDQDRVSSKLRTVKLRQDSNEHASFFAAFKCPEVQTPKYMTMSLAFLKATSIYVLSQKRFLILDSTGDLHLLSLHNTDPGSGVTCETSISSKEGCMSRLDYTMKVQVLAVLPDVATKSQSVWISDGFHSVHMISVADVESPVSENDRDKSEERRMQVSAMQAIFTSEKIQDIIPVGANAALILGQGSIFAYVVA